METSGILLGDTSLASGEAARTTNMLVVAQAILADIRSGFAGADCCLFIDEAQVVLQDNQPMVQMLLREDAAARALKQSRGIAVSDDLPPRRLGVVIVNQNSEQVDKQTLEVLRGLPCQIIMGAHQEDAGRHAQQYRSQGLEPADFRSMVRGQHQWLKLPSSDTLFSALTLGHAPSWQEPLPPTAGEDWRGITAPAQSEDTKRLDEAIRWFKALNARSPSLAVQRLGQLCLTNPETYDRFCARTRAHRLTQRAFLLANPGAIPHKGERIRTLSALLVGVPVLETRAFQWALLMQAYLGWTRPIISAWATLPDATTPLETEQQTLSLEELLEGRAHLWHPDDRG